MMMRMQYEGWIAAAASPLHADSRVFPPSGLSPAATDDAMRAFPYKVLAANPRPRAVVLDQNLRSQVARHENAITGTTIASRLRAGGYTGKVVIRSANVSARVREEYLAAGADAAMSKDDQRDALVRLVVDGEGGGAASDVVVASLGTRKSDHKVDCKRARGVPKVVLLQSTLWHGPVGARVAERESRRGSQRSASKGRVGVAASRSGDF